MALSGLSIALDCCLASLSFLPFRAAGFLGCCSPPPVVSACLALVDDVVCKLESIDPGLADWM